MACALLPSIAFAQDMHEHHAQNPVPEPQHPAHAHEAHEGAGAVAQVPPGSRSSAPLPPPTAGEVSAAFPDLHGMRMQDHMDDDPFIATLMFDRLEWQDTGDASGIGWELQGWAGGLDNRVWLRSEGERRDGSIEHGDVELLWGRATGPWWNRVVGLRHDLGRGPDRDWLAIGLQGLAPYKFEVAATAYLGGNGRLAARAEAEYALLLTNRLVLQPRAELNLYSKHDPDRGIGKGLGDAGLGLRMRYELHRQFAPYVGYEWSRKFGRSADYARTAGGQDSEAMWVVGIRFWF